VVDDPWMCIEERNKKALLIKGFIHRNGTGWDLFYILDLLIE
jgi:hypothetical protein